MLILTTDYYKEKTPELTLASLGILAERNRAISQAKLANSERKKIKENFQMGVKQIVADTKDTITTIGEQMDTAIKGKVRDSIEQAIPDMLKNYDNIV